jgi:hypothetical protein
VSLKKNHIVAKHLPLMKVVIDFENGNLKLEGDWQFMVASNKNNELGWLTYHGERVKLETDVSSSFAINLEDPRSDGLIFPLEGSIRDGNSLGLCSGLLVLDNVRDSYGLISDQWNISFYLYDSRADDCEIHFKLPVYLGSFNGAFN